jgi:hypothetical protein
MRSRLIKGAGWGIRADSHVCWREGLGTVRFFTLTGEKREALLSASRGQNGPKQCPESRKPQKGPRIAGL